MVSGPGNKRANSTCCGVINEAKYAAREKKARRSKPQPWIVLKLTIGIAAAIIGYTGYVYIGRFCIPMIQRNGDALGNRTMGIAFLVVFGVLLLMTIWSYTTVVLIRPGFAKQYVRKSKRPVPDVPPPRFPHPGDTFDIGGPSYELTSPRVDLSRSATHNQSGTDLSHYQASINDPIPRQSHVSEKSTHRSAQPSRTHSNLPSIEGRPSWNVPTISEDHNVNAGVMEEASQVPPRPVDLDSDSRPLTYDTTDLPPPLFSRRPPTTPVLLPEYRYCAKCEIVKPYRTHHCRACGTCVLRFDHHCPWVGQCVGARNHKFFVNFLEWACLFTLWTFSTVLGLNAQASSNVFFDLDPQDIVIIVLSGLFSLFTALLLASHIILISRNQTTVESVSAQSMKERERMTLRHMYPWYKFYARAQTKRQWDKEWGRIGEEGNLWWLGSTRTNWEQVMGNNIWGWILPIGRSPNDGLSYPTNPRFDDQGRWKRRKDWPAELR